MSRERELRGSVGAVREQAGSGLKHLVRTMPYTVTKWPPTAACSAHRIGTIREPAWRMQLQSQMKRKPALRYASNHQSWFSR